MIRYFYLFFTQPIIKPVKSIYKIKQCAFFIQKRFLYIYIYVGLHNLGEEIQMVKLKEMLQEIGTLEKVNIKNISKKVKSAIGATHLRELPADIVQLSKKNIEDIEDYRALLTPALMQTFPKFSTSVKTVDLKIEGKTYTAKVLGAGGTKIAY